MGAYDILDSAQLFDNLADAVADLQYTYAATARPRFMHKDYVLTRELPNEPALHDYSSVGFVFGRESSGLTNDEVALTNKIMTVDSDPAFPVLNLAQAVAITCYELYRVTHSRDMNSQQQDDDKAASNIVRKDSKTSISSPDDNLLSSLPSTASSPELVAAQTQAAHSSSSSSSSSNSSMDPASMMLAYGRPDLLNVQQLATAGELDTFMQHLFRELEVAQFFEDENKRASLQVS